MNGTVLVVDDEPDIRLLVRLVLEMEGYEVMEATSGQDALAAVDERRPDLILLDIRLPGMDGWEVLRQLRENDGEDHLPVVIMSAHSSEPTLDRATSMGSDDYLVKPFTQNDILRVVERFT